MSIVKPIGRVLPAGTEIVLHDLRKLPHSIIAISGDVTGRTIGDSGAEHFPGQDSTTEMLLGSILHGQGTDLLSYSLQLPGGEVMHSQTTVVADRAGVPLLVFCVNNVAPSQETVADDTTPVPRDTVRVAAEPDGEELIVSDVGSLVDALMRRAILAEGVPTSQMKKRQKLRVVERARAAGIFRMRDSAEFVASALGVSRFTIYNYLNELEAQTIAPFVAAEPAPVAS